VPWSNLEWRQIKKHIFTDGLSLLVDFNLIPLPFSRIIKDGLSMRSIKRMSFEEVKVSLENAREVNEFFFFSFFFLNI
jgi:hypothetical protein